MLSYEPILDILHSYVLENEEFPRNAYLQFEVYVIKEEILTYYFCYEAVCL